MAPTPSRRWFVILALGSLSVLGVCKSSSSPPSSPGGGTTESDGGTPATDGGSSAADCTVVSALHACIPKAISSQIAGIVLDARTGEPAAGSVVVAVKDQDGAPSSITVDSDGKQTSGFVSVGGSVVFGLQLEGAAFPVRLTLVASGDGYNSSSTQLLVKAQDVNEKGEFRGNFSLRLVDVTRPPAGVSVAQAQAGASDERGATRSPMFVATPVSSNTGQVLLSVPSATTVTTAEGKPLTGDLHATVSYYSNSESSSLAAFPGGLANVTVPVDAGVKQDGLFISGGFAAVQIADSAGNVAAKFDKPVTVMVTVPATTTNPITNLPVKAGETIPFWSYNENTGQWSSEGDVTLEDDGNGNFLAKKPVTHLSYFNCDWFQRQCTSSPTITITGNDAQLALELEVAAKGGGFYARHTLTGPDINTVDLLNVGTPAGVPVVVTAYFNGQAVGSITIDDPCAAGKYVLPVNIPTVKPATLTAHVVRTCKNDPTLKAPVPSATVVLILRGGSASPSFATTNASGDASFASLVSALTYDVTCAVLGSDVVKSSTTLVPGANAVELSVPVQCDAPVAAADRAPVITSLLVPRRILSAGESETMVVTAVDPDGDPLSYAWSYACNGDARVALTTSLETSTDLSALAGTGACTITVDATARGVTVSRSVTVNLAVPQGQIDVQGIFVPRPVVTTVTLGDPARCTIARTADNATCSGRARAGAALVGAFSFEPFPGPPLTSPAVTDSCGGAVTDVLLDSASGTGSFRWTPPATPQVCVISVNLSRDFLSDQLPVAVFVSDK